MLHCRAMTDGRTINPDLKHIMTKQMKATTVEVKAGHLSQVPYPREIGDLILEAAGHERMRAVGQGARAGTYGHLKTRTLGEG
jgi:hypothetical protein